MLSMDNLWIIRNILHGESLLITLIIIDLQKNEIDRDKDLRKQSRTLKLSERKLQNWEMLLKAKKKDELGTSLDSDLRIR